MKKVSCLLFLFFICFLSLSGQEVINKRDSINIGKNDNFDLSIQRKSKDRRYIDWENEEQIAPKTEPEQWRRQEFIKTITFQPPKIYWGPVGNGEEGMKGIPNHGDYGYFNVRPSAHNLSIATSSTRVSYPMVVISQVQVNFIYSITDWMSVSGGAYVTKYGMLRYSEDAGLNGSMRFKLSDRFYLKAHGRYSAAMHSNRNFEYGMQGIFPQTYYGAGFEYKINDKIGVEGGVIREFNPMRRKWTNRFYLGPAFY